MKRIDKTFWKEIGLSVGLPLLGGLLWLAFWANMARH